MVNHRYNFFFYTCNLSNDFRDVSDFIGQKHFVVLYHRVEVEVSLITPFFYCFVENVLELAECKLFCHLLTLHKHGQVTHVSVYSRVQGTVVSVQKWR
jgi:hypothetical protein